MQPGFTEKTPTLRFGTFPFRRRLEKRSERREAEDLARREEQTHIAVRMERGTTIALYVRKSVENHGFQQPTHVQAIEILPSLVFSCTWMVSRKTGHCYAIKFLSGSTSATSVVSRRHGVRGCALLGDALCGTVFSLCPQNGPNIQPTLKRDAPRNSVLLHSIPDATAWRNFRDEGSNLGKVFNSKQRGRCGKVAFCIAVYFTPMRNGISKWQNKETLARASHWKHAFFAV